jgi:hypothetical protein
MRHILYEHKYCGFFLAKGIFGYRDEERIQQSSHKGIFEYRDKENPHTMPISSIITLAACQLPLDVRI